KSYQHLTTTAWKSVGTRVVNYKLTVTVKPADETKLDQPALLRSDERKVDQRARRRSVGVWSFLEPDAQGEARSSGLVPGKRPSYQSCPRDLALGGRFLPNGLDGP